MILDFRRDFALVPLVICETEKEGKRGSAQGCPAFPCCVKEEGMPLPALGSMQNSEEKKVNPKPGERRNVFSTKWQFFQSSRSHGVHFIYASVRGCLRNEAHAQTPHFSSHRGLSVDR